jgi:hypothetical protein
MKKWQYLVLVLVTTGFILFSNVLSLFSTPATSSIAPNRASSPPAIPVSDSARSLRFVAVGDLMLGTNYPSLSSLPKDASALLQPAETLIKSADVAFGNLEGCLLNEGGVPKGTGPNVYNFRQPEKYAAIFKATGFDLLSVANNHANDFGPVGIETTTQLLAQLGLAFAGTPSHPYSIFTINGVKVGFIAFAPHKGCLQLNDLSKVVELTKKAKQQCDILLVSFHGGAEGTGAIHVPRKTEYFYRENRGDVYEFAHAVIDAGANIVIGHGPHVPRGLELYKKSLIAYSLGNFCTYAKFNLKSYCGYAPLLDFTVNERGEFIAGQIHSFLQLGEGGPVVDADNSASSLMKKLSEEDFPESPLAFAENGKFYLKK